MDSMLTLPKRIRMRRIIVILCLVAGMAVMAQGQKTRFGQVQEKPDPAKFPLRVHVSGSRIRQECLVQSGNSVCEDELYAEAVIDGKKVELWGKASIGKIHTAVLAPGDYQAQITDEAHNADNSVVSRNYLLLLADGSTWHCALSGMAE